MVKVSLHNVNATGAEAHIAKVLSQSIKMDLRGLKCEECSADSKVVLHIDNSKISVLRTEIIPCCHHFGEQIESALYEVEKA